MNHEQHSILREPDAHRTRLFESPVALVENLSCPFCPIRVGHSAEFQICLPYRGHFAWHVGDDDGVADANQVLFVSRGEHYEVTEPRFSGCAVLMITPNVPLLSELAQTPASRLHAHPLLH